MTIRLIVMDSLVRRPVAITAGSKITRVAFLNRLDPELPSLYEAAKISTPIRIFIDKILASPCIDLSDTTIANGMQLLVDCKKLTANRCAEVMNSPITDSELFISGQ